MNVNERLKAARKNAKMTQEELAERICISRGALATYEIGKASPSDRTIRDIAKATGVSELWLRLGEGEMLAPKSRAQEIADFVAGITRDWPEPKRRIMMEIASIDDPVFWQICADLVKRLAAKDRRG